MFLEKCLQSSADTCLIAVNEFSVARATIAGDNYRSEMYRAEIVFTESTNENEQRPVSAFYNISGYENDRKS